jgi:phosphoglycolate phosphatase-like HAD superfamily hydrolase
LDSKNGNLNPEIVSEAHNCPNFRCLFVSTPPNLDSSDGGNSFSSKKPDPMGVNTILAQFGVDARDALLIGDSDIDVQTARNAGAWAASVTYGFGARDPEAFPADVYLKRLTDLPLLLGDPGG